MPLLIATAAGGASRRSNGIVFVPVLFVALRRPTERLRGRPAAVCAQPAE